jgi:gas vesicle protein
MDDIRSDVHKWVGSARQAIESQPDVQKWVESARHAIESQSDVQKWLESARQALDSQADPKRWESIRNALESQPDVQSWLATARTALESQAGELKRHDPRRPAPFWARPEGATMLSLAMLGVGAAIGYVLAYFLDPTAGRGRRTRTMDKLRSWLRRSGRRAEGLATHAGNKVQGAKHEVGQRVAIPVRGDGQGEEPEQREAGKGPEVVNLP